MTQEDENILFKDLCARLPYGVKFKYGDYDGCDYKLEIISPVSVNISFPLEDCKPYLRPMDSMTDEEFVEYGELDLLDYSNDGFEMPNYRSIDWLNEHHFAYRGLIDKGLALEAPEGMYKTE